MKGIGTACNQMPKRMFTILKYENSYINWAHYNPLGILVQSKYAHSLLWYSHRPCHASKAARVCTSLCHNPSKSYNSLPPELNLYIILMHISTTRNMTTKTADSNSCYVTNDLMPLCNLSMQWTFMYMYALLKQAPMISLLRAGNFLVPKQLEDAITEGVKKTIRRLRISLLGELQLWSTASSSCLLVKYTP